MVVFGSISAMRVAAWIHDYSAPLQLYGYLYEKELGKDAHDDVMICVGKEWYRFGSSFFLPSKRQKLAFIKSGFDGLLPQVDNRGVFDVAICGGKWNVGGSRTHEHDEPGGYDTLRR